MRFAVYWLIGVVPRRGDLTGQVSQVTSHVIRVLSEFFEGVAAAIYPAGRVTEILGTGNIPDFDDTNSISSLARPSRSMAS